MDDSAQRVAIVTGGARNIGATIARRLSADGAAVVVNYLSSADAAAALVNEITASGGRALAVAGDVSDPAAASEVFAAATQAFGGVDVLVNNAGRDMGGTIPIADCEEDLYDRLFAANVKTTFNMMREAARSLRDGGRIINVSTSLVGLAPPGRSVYAATKAAVETMGKVLAGELRGRGITVNTVAPGPVATSFFFDGKTEAEIEGFARQPPLERLGTPDDVADMVAFLASAQGGWVNGQTIRVNGGLI